MPKRERPYVICHMAPSIDGQIAGMGSLRSLTAAYERTAETFDAAELFQVKTGSHGATDLSPVCMAAALHFDLSVHNFGIQEYMRHREETDRVFPHRYTFERGFMHPGDATGLDIDESLAAKFPYQRAYLPVNRKTDGTVHSW